MKGSFSRLCQVFLLTIKSLHFVYETTYRILSINQQVSSQDSGFYLRGYRAISNLFLIRVGFHISSSCFQTPNC